MKNIVMAAFARPRRSFDIALPAGGTAPLTGATAAAHEVMGYPKAAAWADDRLQFPFWGSARDPLPA